MFEASDFIYLQLQKTACTHISKIFQKVVGGTQSKVKHNWLLSYDDSRIKIGSIRNPWDWYVSLWAYGCGKRGRLYEQLTKKRMKTKTKLGLLLRGKVAAVMSESRKDTEAWQKLYADAEDPNLFQQWLKKILQPENHVYLGEGYHESSLSDFSGFMTFRYCYIHLKNFFNKDNFHGIRNISQLREFDSLNNLLDHVIRMENLEDDLIRVLQEIGYELDQESKDWIYSLKKEKTNKSDRKGFEFYYNQETVDLVFDKERFIIEKYDYESPSLA